MRPLMILILLSGSMTLSGCSKDAPSVVPNAPTVSNQPPALAPNNALPSTVESAPEFDPKLTLEWPGTSEESRRRINAGQADEMTIYGATLMQSQSGPVAIFQRQRQWPTRFIQALSAVAVKQILRFVRSIGPPRFPLLARLLIRTPMVRYIAPQIVAFGISRVHVEPSTESLRIGSKAWLAVTMIG